MFDFLGKGDKLPLSDAKAAARWLASLASGDPVALQAELVSQLAKLVDGSVKRTPASLEAAFLVDARAQQLRAILTTQYLTHARRSSQIEEQLWRALFDLTQAFLACYNAFARDVAEHPHSNRWQGLLAELTARQIVHLGHDARVRLYHCEPWIPGRWAELFALFGMACGRSIERRPVVLDPESGPTTIEHEFIVTLVLERMNPGSLGAEQVESIATHLHDWCRPLRLTLEAASPATLYVDLASRAGLRRRDIGPLEGRVLFLDTRPLHAVLQQNIAVHEQKIRDEPLAPEATRRRERLAVFTKVAARIDPEYRPLQRRGKRVAANENADAVVGFSKIVACLHDDALGPLNVEASRTFSGAEEIAIFGQSRNEPSTARTIAEQRLALYLAVGGSWEVKDISESGFRVVAPAAGTDVATLGTLVALRLPRQDRWVLCIVRRMTRRTTERAEMGLELIASSLAGVELIEQRKFADAGYSVNGEQALVNGRVFRCLLLSMASRPGGPEVRSVVVPAVEYQPAKRFKLKTSNAAVPVRFGRQLDQRADWTWATIEPLERSSAQDDIAAPAR
jgi:hypothetical protein